MYGYQGFTKKLHTLKMNLTRQALKKSRLIIKVILKCFLIGTIVHSDGTIVQITELYHHELNYSSNHGTIVP